MVQSERWEGEGEPPSKQADAHCPSNGMNVSILAVPDASTGSMKMHRRCLLPLTAWSLPQSSRMHAEQKIRVVTFLKPMSLAYSRKHWRQMFRPYFLMMPHWFPHTRLHCIIFSENTIIKAGGHSGVHFRAHPIEKEGVAGAYQRRLPFPYPDGWEFHTAEWGIFRT
jgi:hypothetical protein